MDNPNSLPLTTSPLKTTIKLSWYEQIHVRSYRKFCPDYPKNRIVSIDWYKGYAIMIITFVHLMATWADPWAWRLFYVPHDFVGPTTFLLFAGINTTFSYRIGQAYGISQKKLYLDTCRRMFGMLVIAVLWNVILGAFYNSYTDLLNIHTYLRWDVLQTIAFAVVLTLPSQNWAIKTRFLLAIGIILISVLGFQYLDPFSSESILASSLIPLFFYPFQQSPLFPLVAITILGGIIIDLLIPYLQLRPEFSILKNLLSPQINCRPQIQLQKNERYRTNTLTGFKIVLGAGLCSFVGGIIFGLQSPTHPFYTHEIQVILDNLHTNPWFVDRVTFIPAFLITNTLPNIFFKLGIVILFFSIVFYYFDIKHVGRKTYSKFTKQLVFMGEYTFSYFIYVAIFNLFPLHFNIWVIWIPMWLVILGLTWFFRQLLKHAWGAGMMEWCMNLFTLKLTTPATYDEISLAYPEKIQHLEEQITIKSK